MSWVGFESTIPASEREKSVDALDRAATVTGLVIILAQKIKEGNIRNNEKKSK
jgi:hypothetical protein